MNTQKTNSVSFPHILLAILICAVWGFNFVVIKVGVTGLPALLLAALRFFFSAIPAVFFVPKPKARWRWIITYSLLLGVGEFGFLFVAIRLGAPAGLSSIILQSQAFFTALLAALFLKEKIHTNNVIGMLIAAAGLGLILLGNTAKVQEFQSLTLPLVLMLLLGALGWAGANVSVKAMPGVNALSLMVWSSLFSPLPLLGLSFLFEGSQAWIQGFAHLSWETILALLYLVVLSTLFGYGAWNHLIGLHGAGKIAPFSLLVPFFALSSAGLFLGETFSKNDILASGLILLGLCVHVFGGRLPRLRRKQNPI